MISHSSLLIERTLGALAHHLFGPIGCILAACLVVTAPLYLAHLVESIDFHDPSRCTLDAATCDKLRQSK